MLKVKVKAAPKGKRRGRPNLSSSEIDFLRGAYADRMSPIMAAQRLGVSTRSVDKHYAKFKALSLVRVPFVRDWNKHTKSPRIHYVDQEPKPRK